MGVGVNGDGGGVELDGECGFALSLSFMRLVGQNLEMQLR